MSDITPSQSAHAVVSSTSNGAGSTTRGTFDKRGKGGAILTLKTTNGATGPTVACTCSVLIAHNNGATPTAAAAGADWKTLWAFSGGTTANLVTERSFVVPPEVMHLEVEFTGNTGQAVTVEAHLSVIDKHVAT